MAQEIYAKSQPRPTKMNRADQAEAEAARSASASPEPRPKAGQATVLFLPFLELPELCQAAHLGQALFDLQLPRTQAFQVTPVVSASQLVAIVPLDPLLVAHHEMTPSPVSQPHRHPGPLGVRRVLGVLSQVGVPGMLRQVSRHVIQ